MDSATSKKILKMFLTAPQQPVRVAVGDSFPVGVNLTTGNVRQCEAKLVFDSSIFEDISGQANPHQLIY